MLRPVITWGDGLIVDRVAECQWAGLLDMTQVKAARARRRGFRLRLLVLGSGRRGVGDIMPVFTCHLLPTLGKKDIKRWPKRSLRRSKEATARLPVTLILFDNYKTSTYTTGEM